MQEEHNEDFVERERIQDGAKYREPTPGNQGSPGVNCLLCGELKHNFCIYIINTNGNY